MYYSYVQSQSVLLALRALSGKKSSDNACQVIQIVIMSSRGGETDVYLSQRCQVQQPLQYISLGGDGKYIY